MIEEYLPYKIISIVGSGGKTSLMYALAESLAHLDKKIIITTSTKIFLPEKYPVVLFPQERKTDFREKLFCHLKLELAKSNVCALGNLYTEDLPSGKQKLSSCLDNTFSATDLLKYTTADYILIESDGSKHKPLKFPADHEPVIPTDSQLVIAVVGLWAIGQPIKQVCHRFELACDFLTTIYRRPITPDHLVTKEDVELIVNSPLGYKKNLGSKPFKLTSFRNPPLNIQL